MHLPMDPSPATSTTFSCQLSNTLMAAPVDSFAAPGRPEIWLNPVSAREGARGAAPTADAEPLMPLYLLVPNEAFSVNVTLRGVFFIFQNTKTFERRVHGRGESNVQILDQNIQ
jgi:hypothetical protein